MAFVISRAWLIWLEPHISDVELYFEYFDLWFHQGLLPYRDLLFEYPPLAMIPIMFPASLVAPQFPQDLLLYRLCFISTMLAVDYSIYRFFKKNSDRKTTILYIVSILFLGQLVFDRIDLLLGLLILLPFFPFARSNRYFIQDAILGVGGLFKLVPMIFIGLPGLLGGHGILRSLRGALVSITVFGLGIGALLHLAGDQPTLFSYHTMRGIQVESLIGNMTMVLAVAGLAEGIGVVNNYGAQHISGLPDFVVLTGKLLSAIAVFGTFGAVVVGALRGRRIELLDAVVSLMLAFVVFNTVLSPQFILWLVPIVLYARWPGQGPLFIAVCALTGVHFFFYWQYVQADMWLVVNLFLRNALLLVLWWGSLRQLFKHGPVRSV